MSLQFLNGNHSLFSTNDSVQFLELVNIHSLVISGLVTATRGDCIIAAPYASIRNVSSLSMQNCNLVDSLFEIFEIDSLVINEFSFTNSDLFISSTNEAQITNTWFSLCSCILSQLKSLFLSDNYSNGTRLFVNLGNKEIDHSQFNSSNLVMSQSYIFLYLGDGDHKVVFKESSFFGQSSGIVGYIQSLNAVLNVEKCSFMDDSNGVQIISGGRVEIVVSECRYERNQIGLSVTVQKGDFNAFVQNTVFDMLNHKQGLQTYFFAFTDLNQKHLTLRNVSYLHNYVNRYLGTIVLSGPLNLTIEDCTFSENFGLISTVFLRFVDTFFSGTNSFLGNFGSTGGALYMSHSTIWLDRGAYITFENNAVTNLGGAIFIEEDRSEVFLDVLFRAETKIKCFYQLPFSLESSPDLPILSFTNNSAETGGDDIYGTSLASSCEVTPNGTVTSGQVKDQIFQFHSASLSPVSSSSRRVCLCENNVPQCDNLEYIFWNTSATSGEKFTVSLALVGDDFGTVTGVVYASNFEDLIADQSLGDRQKHQQVITNKECSNLEYSVHSRRYEVTIYLSKDSVAASSQRAIRSSLPFSREGLTSAGNTYNEQGIIEFILLYVPVSITVSILPCPLGFKLNTTDLACHCEDFFSEYIQNCSVENRTGLLLRNGTVWLSAASLEGNSTGAILAHKLCPFGYCLSSWMNISLVQPDEQCDFNHSGILCGGCPPGFSLAIGSSRCLQCSDERYLSLLLAFIVAGIALVFLIKILDLTVAHGTVNGLIFYANVMWINHAIFFANGSDHSSFNVIQFYQIVKVFVAWLNLDLGIETCFFTGLDAYWKTWLQFAFPVYLWTPCYTDSYSLSLFLLGDKGVWEQCCYCFGNNYNVIVCQAFTNNCNNTRLC